MKLRPILLAIVLVGGFVWFTTGGRWPGERLAAPARLWTSPEPARSANLTPEENSNISIYRSASPATVFITSVTYQRGFFREIYPVRGSGSGFLIDADGRILTNEHVVSGRGASIEVTLEDKTRYKAQIVAADSRNDLAMLKIQPRGKLAFLKQGDSAGLLVGQKVLAIGNPFGLEGTLTTGVISSLGREIQDENGRVLEDLIQTDAAINPGNSGGPLLNSAGEVIAINTAIYGPGGNIGIGFAMPINRARLMVADMTSTGRLRRPFLGVSHIFIPAGVADALGLGNQPGVLVQDVEGGSAAQQAGLRGATREVEIGNTLVGVGGDFIVALDGQAVTSSSTLTRVMERKKAGDPLDLTLIRNRRTIKVTVTLGEAPQRR